MRMVTPEDWDKALKDAKPPKDFTVEYITAWLEKLKNSPEDEAVQYLLERVDTRTNGEEVRLDFTSMLNGILAPHEDKKELTTA